MCIIVYKPGNVTMPDYETLKNCFDNNGDGAGYMFADNNKVHIVKGLMTFDGFLRSFTKTVKQYGKDRAYVLHFRWSTQAGIRRDCTHPFPLSKNMNELRKLKTTCDIGIVHNGIIPLTSSYSKTISYSDTMEFITGYLSLIIKNRGYYKDKDTLKLIEKLTESKLAVLDGAGHCELTGDDWLCDNGVFYSNDSYQVPTVFSSFGVGDDDCFPQRLTHYERYYNPMTGCYDFDNSNCPLFEEGIDLYCGHCRDFGACYSNAGADREKTKF